MNCATFLLDINSVLIKVFSALQHSSTGVDKRWFIVGNPQNFHSSFYQKMFEMFIHILMALGFLGMLLSLKQKGVAKYTAVKERYVDEGVESIAQTCFYESSNTHPTWLSTFFGSMMVYACLLAAHSITYMDLMYYYNKMPFLFIFTGFLLTALEVNTYKLPFINYHITSAGILKVLLLLYGLCMTIMVIVF